jgi:hypothetical protein
MTVDLNGWTIIVVSHGHGSICLSFFDGKRTMLFRINDHWKKPVV